ncbi:MAG: ABC transporter ATP-binding protein [Clostridiales bacterium]|nr:ABC transporter ATP-binding protein [Clostridiales bacterium]
MNEIIACNGLTKRFENRRLITNAVSNVTFDIEESSINLITGKSGSGKSTLLNMISGIEKPTSGEVWINKQNYYKEPETIQAKIRSENYGYVFQSYHLISELNIENNIKIPNLISGNKFDIIYYKNLVDQLDIADLVTKYPSELSGGEQQRVGIARAMINKPRIIFADEPTGNLDSVNTQNVADIIYKFNLEYKITFIIVTHDEELILNYDKKLVMRDGELVEE